jgi:hypothetical protein
VLRGFSTYGTVDLINPRLKAPYAALDSASLVRRCGHEIITREIRGAQVALIYHVENLSESTVSKLEQSFQAGVSYGALSADLKSKYQQFLARAASASRVSLNIDAIGGPGVAALSGLVTAADDVSHVEAVVSTYLSKISADNAPGLRFFSASTLGTLAGRQDAEPERHGRRVLIGLYYTEIGVQSKLAQVQRALDPNGIYLRQLDSSTVQRLSAAEKQLKAADREIRAAAEKCGKGEDCAPTDSDVTRIDVSFLPQAPKVKWQQSQAELDITLESVNLVSEVYLRPSWMTGISGVGDEPTFTRKIWSSESVSEAAILAAGRSNFPLDAQWRDFLYITDRNASKVVVSGSAILVTVKEGPLMVGYLSAVGQAPPVTHKPQLIVSDRFGRTFTLDLGSPKCPELQQCAMDELDRALPGFERKPLI